MTTLNTCGAINKTTYKFVFPHKSLIKSDGFMCCKCGEDLILRAGEINIPHFAHKKSTTCSPGESDIHWNAKEILKNVLESGIELVITRGDQIIKIKCDNTQIVEVECAFQYNNRDRRADVAILHESHIEYIFEILCTSRTFAINRPEPWFEFSAEAVINAYKLLGDSTQIHLNCVRNMNQETIPTIEFTENECIEKLVEPECHLDSRIYVNQRGAGCGKTYESIQILNSQRPEFQKKTTYIYLTKMHSAKEVVLDELHDQFERGALPNLIVEENIIDTRTNGKQYRVLFNDEVREMDINVIIGTIDSFTHAVVNKDKVSENGDYFQEIVNCIGAGEINCDPRYVHYGINENCLILIDEAQDLGEEYFDAFNTIVNHTKVDVYIIGDRLQSIWGDHNIMTYVDSMREENIIKNTGENKVMRFHNRQFISFVNDIIPFETYNLPKITSICASNCSYSHEDDIKPYNVFEVPNIVSGSSYKNESNINKIVMKVISYMNEEIITHGYLPHNFMFIFPMISKSILAMRLLEKLQDFWVDRFADSSYKNIADKSEHWRNRHDMINQYVYLHKSDEGKSIDLRESEHASRILSIHASKGNGAEVVFVFDLSESMLNRFSKKTGNLCYDSLLHVAITRQKKKLYIALNQQNNDIYSRFKKYITHDNSIHCELLKTYKQKNESFIKTLTNKNMYESLNVRQFHDLLNNRAPSQIIDWGHHLIRYAVMESMFLWHIKINNDVSGDQFTKVMRELTRKTPQFFNYNEYIRELKNTMDEDNMIIPILRFSSPKDSRYYRFTNTLRNIIINVLDKIRIALNKKIVPEFCPLECVIFIFMYKLIRMGYHADFSIIDVYDIMYSYSQLSNVDDVEKCECCDEFSKFNIRGECKDDVKKSILNHYNNLDKIEAIYEGYKLKLIDMFPDEIFKYNVNHKLRMFCNKEDVQLEDGYWLIAYSDKTVIYFIIKPQLTRLNINDIMVEIGAKSHMINKIYDNDCDEDKDKGIFKRENYKKFGNKKTYACLITLDSEDPIFVDFDVGDKLDNPLKEYLFSRYSENHGAIYRSYRDKCAPNSYNPKEILNSDKLPKYVRKYFTNVLDNIMKGTANQRKELINELMDESAVVKKLNELLKESIDILTNPPIEYDF